MQRTWSSQGHLKLLLCVAPPLARWVLLVPLVLSALGPVRSVCGISAVRLPAGSIATCWSQKSYDSTHLPRSRIWCRGWVSFWADVVGGEHEKVLKLHAVVPTKAETKCRTTCFCNQFAMVICRKRKFWKTYSSHLMTWHVTDPCDRWVRGLTHDRFREKDKMGRRVISDFVRLYLDIAQVCTGIESTFHLGESNPTQNLWESLAWKIFSSYSYTLPSIPLARSTLQTLQTLRRVYGGMVTRIYCWHLLTVVTSFLGWIWWLGFPVYSWILRRQPDVVFPRQRRQKSGWKLRLEKISSTAIDLMIFDRTQVEHPWFPNVTNHIAQMLAYHQIYIYIYHNIYIYIS